MFDPGSPPVRSGLELITKIVAIAGPLFAALKAAVTYAIDQSIARKAARTAEQIDACLGRLTKLETDTLYCRTRILSPTGSN